MALELYLAQSPFSSAYGDETWTVRYRKDDFTAADIPSAVLATLTDPPIVGDAVPAPLTNMFVQRKTVDSIVCNSDTGQYQAFGQLIYQRPTQSNNFVPPLNDDGPVIVISRQSQLVAVETTVDRDGNPITVEDEDSNETGRRVQVLKPRVSFVAVRQEKNKPDARISAHEGTVNNAPWNGYATNAVLLESIEADQNNGGDYFDVSYTFVIDPNLHRIRVTGDTDKGRPIAAPAGNQSKLIDVQPESNFALLSIAL